MFAEYIDIKDPKYRFHWTNDVNQLPRILSRGLYSLDFAQRIGDQEFKQTGGGPGKFVYTSLDPFHCFYGQEAFGLIILLTSKRSPESFRRIKPSFIKGLMVVDRSTETSTQLAGDNGWKQFAQDQIKVLESVFVRERQPISLPIYGLSGLILRAP